MKPSELRVGSSYAARHMGKNGNVVRAVYMGVQTTERCEFTAFGSKMVRTTTHTFAYVPTADTRSFAKGLGYVEADGFWHPLDTKPQWVIPWGEWELMQDQVQLAARENKAKRKVVEDRVQAALDALGVRRQRNDRYGGSSANWWPYVDVYSSHEDVDECGNRVYTYDPIRTSITLSLPQLEALVGKSVKTPRLKAGERRPAFK